jgi:hypothetical protein
MELEVSVTDKCNPYKLVRDKFGREKKETNLPNPYGATSMREWENGIIVVRKVALVWGGVSSSGFTDRISIPDSMKDFIKEVKSYCVGVK